MFTHVAVCHVCGRQDWCSDEWAARQVEACSRCANWQGGTLYVQRGVLADAPTLVYTYVQLDPFDYRGRAN